MRKLWNYIKAWFGKKTEDAKDPEIEIEQAINEAQSRDRELRNQAAKVVAHRTRTAAELEDAGEEAAKARELAKQALLKADAAATAGNADEAARWTQAAQTMAMKIQASDSNVATLRAQLQSAESQAEQAKQAVNQNAMRLQEMTAKRIELLGKLESARMQESVNKAMDQLTATVGDDAPTLKEVEDKIQQRAAMASAKAELRDATPEGAMVELEHEVNLAEADRTLDELRVEMGLGAAPAVGTPEVAKTPPAGEIASPPPAAPPAVEAPSQPATEPGEVPAAPVEAPKPPPSS
jgi:phage shock protein A